MRSMRKGDLGEKMELEVRIEAAKSRGGGEGGGRNLYDQNFVKIWTAAIPRTSMSFMTF